MYQLELNLLERFPFFALINLLMILFLFRKKKIKMFHLQVGFQHQLMCPEWSIQHKYVLQVVQQSYNNILRMYKFNHIHQLYIQLAKIRSRRVERR